MQEDIKSSIEANEANGDAEKSSRETYPIKPFRLIESFVGNVYKKYGSSGVQSMEKIADANNLAVNSIKQTLSTAAQYGVMKRVYGQGYSITDTFPKIFHPENDDEKLSGIIECLKNVPFYRPLFNDYNDKIVPSLEGLQNRFIREYGMKSHIAKNAAEIFLQNLKDCNLINPRGVLILRNEFKPGPTDGDKKEENKDSKVTKPSNETEDNSENVKIPVRLKSGKMAFLTFPVDFTDEDLIKIFKVLKAYIEAYGDSINPEALK